MCRYEYDGKSMGMDLRVWDVGRGTAIWTDAASRDVLIDLGATEFSPLEHLDARSSINTVELLIVTHPHKNHIRDIVRYVDVEFSV